MNRRRKAALAAAILILNEEYEEEGATRKRRFWIHAYFTRRKILGEYWTDFLELKQRYNEPGYGQKFLEYTRLTWSAYSKLYSLVENQLTKSSPREPIGAEERLVVTLKFLATGNSFRSLAFSFRIPNNTISIIIAETCQIIWEVLSPIYLKVPQTHEEWQKIADQFYEKTNVPNLLGCIDGKHVQMTQPARTEAAYRNYKFTFSTILLAVCDPTYCFIYCDVGSYGSQGDANLFESSHFKNWVETGAARIPDGERMLPGAEISTKYFFVGDSAFPLLGYLQKPFTGEKLPREKRIFNYRMMRARRMIENSFGILTCRWRALLKMLETSSTNSTKIVKAACCLHNFSIVEMETNVNPTRLADRSTDQDDGDWRRMVVHPLRSARMIAPHTSRHKRVGEEIRTKLIEYFNGVGAVPWQDRSVDGHLF